MKKSVAKMTLSWGMLLSAHWAMAIPPTPRRTESKRAAALIIDKGEVFIQKKSGRVKVVTSADEWKFIIKACSSDPTSGHFGATKTWQRVAESFYWKGLVRDVSEQVGLYSQTFCPIQEPFKLQYIASYL